LISTLCIFYVLYHDDLTLSSHNINNNSIEHFDDAGVQNFEWAEAITGVTIVLLVCLEWAVDRFIASTSKKSSEKKLSIGSDEEDGVKAKETPLVNEEYDSFHENEAEHEHEHEHEHSHTIRAENPLGSLLLTIALSIHSVIEGLGIGAADTADSFSGSFIAVAFHKAFTAFALGNSLISDGLWEDKSKRKYFYLSVGTFIILAIIGIGIGWTISAADGSLVTTGILIAITGGSFVFVATMEILPTEAKIIKHERLPVLAVAFSFVSGYSLMALLALWA
jgi:zinc transporter ZupT